jgi:hypothetical protein
MAVPRPDAPFSPPAADAATVFVLSPARCDGQRAVTLLSPRAQFPLALQLRRREGAALGDVFAFLSGLYFRGKLAYAQSFARAGAVASPVRIITTTRGLLTPEHRVRAKDLVEFAGIDLAKAGEAFRKPLLRDARRIAREAPDARVVLLGSIATDKYVTPLLRIFGDRLLFPIDFVGRGDMSRGGLLLRCVRANLELPYVPLRDAVRHGERPPKLPPLPR